MTRRTVVVLLLPLLTALAGCATNTRGENGSLIGGVGGAGLGAIAGNQVGHPVAGAAIGAIAGAVTGGVIGNELDEIEAQNRAQIAATMGRPISASAVSPEDVMEMSQRGVPENVISTHIRAHGTTRAVDKNDLIQLSQAGVHPNVISAMQQPPVVRTATPAVYAVPGPPPPAVIVEHYDPYCYGPPPYWRHRHHHRHPGYSVGFTYAN